MMRQKNLSPFIVPMMVILTVIALFSLLALFQEVYQHINHVAFLEMKANRN